MRGYRFLKKNGQLGLLVAVQNELVDTRLDKISHNASKFFLGAGAVQADLIIRQYLFSRSDG
ncbi:MAG: hypothetical protein QMD94_00295, partial [Candidatus Omnitrophota bacterium]|nr:hypothetical protein [Candidatus Omnitrophota bacterium]